MDQGETGRTAAAEGSSDVDAGSAADKADVPGDPSAAGTTDPTVASTAADDGGSEKPSPVAGAGPTEEDAENDTVVVVEEGVVGKRLRRPIDLVRLFIALLLMLSVAVFAYFATGTTTGLGEDIEEASRQLPDIVRLLLNVVGGLGLLTLPVAAAVDLLIRGRGRQLLDALMSLFFAVVLLTVASILISSYGSLQLIVSLAGSTSAQDTPLLPLLGALMAFITTARLVARAPWAIASVLVIASLFVVSVISGGTTIAGIGLSLITGWAVGLATRYTLGTPTTRPSGWQVAETLARSGHPVSLLEAQETTEVGRRYSGAQRSGPSLEIFVLDRDLEGAGLAQALWQSLRLRDPGGRRSFNMRRSLEQRALLAYAAQVGNIPAARLVAAREVGADSSLLAYERVSGTRLTDLAPDDVEDSTLDSAWAAVQALRAAGVAHRRLTGENLVVQDDGTVRLLGIGHGTVAAGDVTLRIDIAELLCSLALLVGEDRAIASGRRVLGPATLAKALPVLQPVALSGTTKKRIRKNKDLLVSLRDSLIEIKPDAEVERIELERFKPRTIIMIVLGSIAAYFLFAQLAEVDLVTLFANANWWWLAVALLASIMTYPGAAWSLTGFVPEKVKLFRTMMAQLAGDFATLVAPPTLGAVAINLRFLQKQGIHPALATASIGVAQVVAFTVHIILLLSFAVAAGTQQDFSFDPPTAAILIGVAVLVLVGSLLLLRPVRKLIWDRVGPLLKEVGPRLLTVAQTPAKIAEGVGGMFLLNLGYIVCLSACVEAFGGDLSFAAIAVVYLTGSVIGQAAPTPGGLGAVEAAMAAGLVAAGLDSGLALSAVLLYRVITFWLPTVPGWFAFNWLQRKNYL